jgi:hypothetical protein
MDWKSLRVGKDSGSTQARASTVMIESEQKANKKQMIMRGTQRLNEAVGDAQLRLKFRGPKCIQNNL